MKFNEHSSKTNWYPGTTREATEQGYEAIPCEGVQSPYKPQNSDVRLGIASVWDVRKSSMEEEYD